MISEWDYSHAQPKGKNVFFLRDSNHVSEEVQEHILGELDRLVDQHFFSVLFSEGLEGKYSPDFRRVTTEERLKTLLVERCGRWSPMQVFAYRHQEIIRSGNFSLYGVDSEALLDEQIKSVHRNLELCDKLKREGSLSPAEIQEFRWHKNVNAKRIAAERSAYSVKKIEELMRDFDTAGLIYGNGHFPEMAAGFETINIGYISYFPGEPEFDLRRSEEYIRKL